MTPAVLRLIRRTIVSGSALFVCMATTAVLYLRPEPLFDYRADDGNLTLYCDTPFVTGEGLAVLRDISRRLETSPIYPTDERFRVFICNKPWHSTFYFLPDRCSGGISYLSSHAVFLSGGDISRALLRRHDGTLVTDGGSLAYFAAHEIAHVCEEAVADPIDYLCLPDWIREGYVDYVARGSLFGDPEMREAFLRNPSEMNTPAKAPYRRYNLLVGYYLEAKHLTLCQLFDAAPEQKDVEAELRKYLEK